MEITSKKSIGLISQWPGIKNAEFELLEKIRRTEGFHFRLIDYLGYDIETGERLDHHSLEFAIAFHFDTPHYINCFTYCMIINPIEYLLLRPDYADWPGINYLSYDAYAMAKSATILRYHLNNMLNRDIAFDDYPEFYPSVSRNNVLSSCKKFSRIFYCGINWERLTDKKGRHDDLLKKLDIKNIIALYGPQRLEGKLLWKGFKNYCGEIPFDGTSIIKSIHECGISLVLSSDVHLANETASSRIYESCAAGAVIISDENPFIEREFGDSVLYFKRKNSAFQDATQIIDLYTWIQKNPVQAAEMAARSQQILIEKFCTERVFNNIYLDFNKRCASKKLAAPVNAPLISILFRILDHDARDHLTETIASICDQNYPNVELIVICYPELANYIKKKLAIFKYPFHLHIAEDIKQRQRNTKKGKILQQILPAIQGEYFIIIEPGWRWHQDHISSLFRECNKDFPLAVSGVFADNEKKAPLDVSKIPRVFTLPKAEHFEFHEDSLLNLPCFLIARSLLDRLSELITLFEYHEALLFFMDMTIQGKKIGFSRKFTASRFLSDFSSFAYKKPNLKIDSFWKKVSKKLGSPVYERKIIFDRVRFSDYVKEDTKMWLIDKKKNHKLYTGDEFEVLVLGIKHRFPYVYAIARFFVRLFRLPFKLLNKLWDKIR